jgi:hypothetical protein
MLHWQSFSLSSLLVLSLSFRAWLQNWSGQVVFMPTPLEAIEARYLYYINPYVILIIFFLTDF